eukprot:CCRYP_002364-RB/>CCRYP_002364-RB protein AED:0.23 eAED:0.12 QI:0/-1/0/1/-1/0/1/0/316
MILYHTDSNSIWVEPTKNRTEGELTLARTRALSRMRACGLSPKHQVLDNEASGAYKQAILNSGMTYQLVPPDDHRRNVTKKAIQTWNDHFVAVLSGTADKFPLHLWCQLIPNMEQQLNLLRQSNANPRISAYAHLYGPHDYNASPFVPLGMEALAHDKPHRRKTYAQHCSRGWIIGTSIEHYRCWKIWSPTTRSTRIAAALCSSNTNTSPIHPCPRPTPSSLPQPILLTSLSTMPKHSTLGPKTYKTSSASSNFSVMPQSNRRYHQHQPHQSLPTPHLQGCNHIRKSPLPGRSPPPAPLSLMMRTVTTKWRHLQGC